MARVRSAILTVAIIAVAFAIYLANGEFLGSYDSMPNSLLAANALATGRLDLDDFRGSYFTALGGQYAFVEAPNGHLTSVFPIGTAIVAAPIELAFALMRAADPTAPPLTAAAAEPTRQHDEKLAAALLAALAVGLCWRCGLLLGTPWQAGIVTAVFAVGTPMWAIAAQALWQHGPVNLAVLALVFALLRAGRTTGRSATAWVGAAGLAAGLLPVIRPTALLFTLAAAAFVLATQRGRAGWFAAGATVGIAPGLAWNLAFFHTLVGGYGSNAAMFGGTLGSIATAFAGLLISPNRGLFVFAPVLLFSLVGFVRALRRGTRDALLLAMLAGACAALTVLYACFPGWWAGFTYGPRFLADTSAVAALLLVFAVPADPLRAARRSLAAALTAGAFVFAAFASLAIEFAGANGGAAGAEWNAVPVSVDLAPERVWDVDDSQIGRNVRGAFYRFAPPPPVAGAAATVVAVRLEPLAARGGRVIEARARVANDGPSTLAGYRSGRYGGQLRVRVRLTSSGAAPTEQLLYVGDAIAPGAVATAIGWIHVPAPPARWRIVCEPVLVGGAPVRERAPFALAGGGAQN